MTSKRPERWIRFGDKVFPEKAFIPANGCVVRERPKGHKQYYHYLYYRMGGRLQKRYIPKDEVNFTKKIIAAMRQRNKRNIDIAERLTRFYLKS